MPFEPESLEQEAVQRLAACRTWKSYIELDLKEIYFLTAPNRQRQISSMVMPAVQRMLDAPELNTDVGFIVVGDFITEVVNAFLPQAMAWCEYGPGMDLPPNAWKQVEETARTNETKIFDAIKASNFYSEIPKAYYPDLGIGTVGMWVSRPHPAKPIVCSAIPLRELEIDLGPYGEIDTRFAVRYTRNHYVQELVGKEIWDKMDSDTKTKVGGKPTDRTQIVWGFWRKWDDKTDEVWQHVVMRDNAVLHEEEYRGEGSCPLVVTRFNPTADWPHGIGPTYQSLPSLRQIDELERMRIDHGSLSLRPPIIYPDDSTVNLDQGLEEGMAYPCRQGQENLFREIYRPPPPDAANYQFEEKVKNLRKLHFVDHPEQTGDTPPTATQWMDELARAQRRIGTPGMSFWREGPAQYFLRFKYLLEAAGKIAPLKVDGRTVATMPRNPAQAAAEQQEIVKTMQIVTYFAQTFPEEFKVRVDGGKTMQNFAEKARSLLIAWRKPEDIQNAVAQMAKLTGDRPVPGQPGIPGPAA
jgi:head-to-tail connecting protein